MLVFCSFFFLLFFEGVERNIKPIPFPKSKVHFRLGEEKLKEAVAENENIY